MTAARILRAARLITPGAGLHQRLHRARIDGVATLD